jgi:RhtB (resistance to homoserine/threonine) family protein
MFDAQLLAFTLVALIVTLSPGPDTFLVIGNTLARGVGGGLATVAGIVSGGFVYAALAAFGLAQVLMHSEAAFLAVKLAGAGYLMWLGVGALRASWRRAGTQATPAPRAAARDRRAAYRQGLLTNVLNPKIAVFYLAFLPQFLDADDAVAAKSLLMIGIHYAMGIVWLSLVAFAVHRLGGWLRRGAVRRWLDGVLGSLMTAFGLKLAFEQR